MNTIAIVRRYRLGRVPQGYLRQLVILSQAYGLEAFLCAAEDFDFVTSTVKGTFFEDGKWVIKTVPIPRVIDNLMVTKKTAPFLAKLSKQAFLMNHRLGAKQTIYPLLKNDPVFKPYYLPTETITDSQQIKSFLDEYSSVIVKPGNGAQAVGIVKMTQQQETITVQTDEETQTVTASGLEAFLSDYTHNNYVVQPYIETKTPDGMPFHVRMLVRKNEVGDFELVKNYLEIGILNHLVSNMHQGGGLIWLPTLLKGLFGSRGPKIEAELTRMSTTLPQAFQRHYQDWISALGIDIAIDKQGHLWVMEVNAGPGHEYVKLEDAELRVKAYYYLVSQTSAADRFSNASRYRVAHDVQRYL